MLYLNDLNLQTYAIHHLLDNNENGDSADSIQVQVDANTHFNIVTTQNKVNGEGF